MPRKEALLPLLAILGSVCWLGLVPSRCGAG
jgi:hypothetical protein